MSDVINSIFGRANSGTTTPGGYAAPQAETESETVDTAVAPEIVDTETIEESPADTAEPTEDAAETEVRDETDDSDAAEADDEAEADEDLEDEAVTEETDEAEADEDTAEDEDAVEADSAEDEDTDDTDTVDTEDDATDTDEVEAATDTDEVAEETDADENTVEAEAAEAEADVVDEAEQVVAAAAAARPAAGTRGATTIGDDVVAKIVDRVARKADGVHDLDGEGVVVTVDGDVATVKVSLVLEFGHAVKALGEQIRIDVIEAVEQFLGLDVEVVDVHVADIHFPDTV